MKKKNILLFSILILFSSIAWGVDNGVISYKVIERKELGTIKISLDVLVNLVDGRLPNKQELASLSSYLVSKENKHDRSFVLFYLPEMKVGYGAYATAHHNPKMKVNIMEFMLYDYPQYRKFIK